MAQINFPVATADGQEFEAPNGVIYTYVGTPPNGYWSGTFQSDSYSTLDNRYLKLDAANDPITSDLTIDGNIQVADGATVGAASNSIRIAADTTDTKVSPAYVHIAAAGQDIARFNQTGILQFNPLNTNLTNGTGICSIQSLSLIHI